jgi:hypothetical protein
MLVEGRNPPTSRTGRHPGVRSVVTIGRDSRVFFSHNMKPSPVLSSAATQPDNEIGWSAVPGVFAAIDGVFAAVAGAFGAVAGVFAGVATVAAVA